jgi:hypothetical protein
MFWRRKLEALTIQLYCPLQVLRVVVLTIPFGETISKVKQTVGAIFVSWGTKFKQHGEIFDLLVQIFDPRQAIEQYICSEEKWRFFEK